MALSWVIWAFALPVLKFCTIQCEREHVLEAGRHERWVLMWAPPNLNENTMAREAKEGGGGG